MLWYFGVATLYVVDKPSGFLDNSKEPLSETMKFEEFDESINNMPYKEYQDRGFLISNGGMALTITEADVKCFTKIGSKKKSLCDLPNLFYPDNFYTPDNSKSRMGLCKGEDIWGEFLHIYGRGFSGTYEMYYYDLFKWLLEDELQYYRNHFGNFSAENMKIDDFFGQCCYYNNNNGIGKCRPKTTKVYFEYINVINERSISNTQKWFITAENKIYSFTFPEYFLAVNEYNNEQLELQPKWNMSGEWTLANYTNFEVIYCI